MFVRGMQRTGVGRVGEYIPRAWKMEDWWKPPAVSVIPGVTNTTVAAAGTGLLALAAAWAAWKYLK